MKKIALILTLVLSTSALAAEPAPMSELCPKIAELSRSVMTARQAGVSMRKVMDVATSPFTVDIITEAYGHPAYTTPEYKEKTIQDFEDQWYLKCIKSYNL